MSLVRPEWASPNFSKSMAIQDIEAGRGVCFIDPHGDSADDLLIIFRKSG